MAPIKAYLELAAHPDTKIPYEPIEDTAKAKKTPNS
jgi:hypothetical protein